MFLQSYTSALHLKVLMQYRRHLRQTFQLQPAFLPVAMFFHWLLWSHVRRSLPSISEAEACHSNPQARTASSVLCHAVLLSYLQDFRLNNLYIHCRPPLSACIECNPLLQKYILCAPEPQADYL